MREKLPEIVLILAMTVDFICGQDYSGTAVQHRTNRRRHHRHRGVLELGRSVAFVDGEVRSMPLFEATDIDNEIIMEPINLPHSTDEYTHFATSDVSDGETSSKPRGIERSMETPSRRYRKRHHHHRHSEHRRQRKRKKARLKELDELRKKVAREERKWWRKRKKELEFEEMFFDQESHNPNVIPTEEPTPCTKTPTTESIEKMPENRTNLSSRIDHFRYHRVNSVSKISHRGEGHALPFVAITDPRPRDVNTKKVQPHQL
ncbi:uncharacterized protein LOC129807347 [Phlebotomus papatasi]|uniref:uncharacterized protein LOC129807347 n=1 Tax=Phlebotomus papatasi TaxID=29031 RepID=UPI00248362F9|nr:uncharacterized protein LOC129807347 [Phlebotomus papatasi]